MFHQITFSSEMNAGCHTELYLHAKDKVLKSQMRLIKSKNVLRLSVELIHFNETIKSWH